jgi:hypothetical protein
MSDSESYNSDSDVDEYTKAAFVSIALEAIDKEDPRTDIVDEHTDDLGSGRLSGDKATELLQALSTMNELDRQIYLDGLTTNFHDEINPCNDSFYKMSTKTYIEGRLSRKIKELSKDSNKKKDKKTRKTKMSREQRMKVKKRAQTDTYLECQEQMNDE